MQLESLFEELEARFDQLQPPSKTLDALTPDGFTNATFGKDHFVGMVEGTTIWRLVAYKYKCAFEYRTGSSRIDEITISKRAKRLVGLWLRVETNHETLAGRLEQVTNGLLLFRDIAVPIKAVITIEVHAVEN